MSAFSRSKRWKTNKMIKVKYPLVPDPPTHAVIKLFQCPRCQDAQCVDHMNEMTPDIK
ncbi:hypothetical protein CGRA01v4_08713 [Colletotrichum graminicola]|nr:hypothetical protein CGRA01v4_08713 [Colletotrichum graminicola]